jgi:hypothetical protein
MSPIISIEEEVVNTGEIASLAVLKEQLQELCVLFQLMN